MLRVMIEKRVDSVLQQADNFIIAQPSCPAKSVFRPNLSDEPTMSPEHRAHDTSFHPPKSTLPSVQPSGPSAVKLPHWRINPADARIIFPKRPPAPEGPTPVPPHPSEQPQSGSKGSTEAVRTECARVLRELCPACFGGTKHGKPLEE